MTMTVELQAPAAAATPQTGRVAWLTRLARPLLGLLLPLSLALGWELLVWAGWSNGRLVPPPSKVFTTIAELAARAS